DRLHVVPVEPDLSRAALQLNRPGQPRQRQTDAVQHAYRLPVGLLPALLRLDRLPAPGLRLGIVDDDIAEDVRVTADQLLGDRAGDVVEIEGALLLRHLGM